MDILLRILISKRKKKKKEKIKQSLELPDFVISKNVCSKLNVYLNLADYMRYVFPYSRRTRSRADRRGWTPNRKPPQRIRLRLKGATECAMPLDRPFAEEEKKKKEKGKTRESEKERDGHGHVGSSQPFLGTKKGGIGGEGEARSVKTALKKTMSNLTARGKGPHVGT